MLARLAGMDVISVSQIVNLLEKHDLVSRKEHPRDTRAKSVTLTVGDQKVLKPGAPRRGND